MHFPRARQHLRNQCPPLVVSNLPSALSLRLSFPSNSATTYKWLARTGPPSDSIPAAGGLFPRAQTGPVFRWLSLLAKPGASKAAGACSPGPSLEAPLRPPRAGSQTHTAHHAAESAPGPRPWPPTPHPGGQRHPGRDWLKIEAHQVKDCRRQEHGARWLAQFALSHFWGVTVFLPRPSDSLPSLCRWAEGRRRCHGWRKRLGVWPGNPPPGCSPPRVCFVHISRPKQRSGSCKSWKHPVMAFTRSGQSS